MEVLTCPGCLERDKRLAALERRVAELEALVREPLDRLGTNATNSGTPPSANPPQASKPVTKKRTGKQPGAHLGASKLTCVAVCPPTPAQGRSFHPQSLLPL